VEYRRFHTALRRRCRRADVNRRARVKAGEKGVVGNGLPAAVGLRVGLRRAAEMGHHVVLEIGDDLVQAAVGGGEPVDPKYGVAAGDRARPLRKPAIAADHPHVVCPLAKAIGGVALNDDGITAFGHRQLNPAIQLP
jgi:hypothetical protein